MCALPIYIVAISGLSKATVADTICDPAVDAPIPAQPIDPPTLAMTFSVNDSPLAGTEGDKLPSSVTRDRLMRAAEANVALRSGDTDSKDSLTVTARGARGRAPCSENVWQTVLKSGGTLT